VHKEYYFLEDANIQKKLPVPEPLHRSSEEERRVVGTKFIIMSFVEGKSYENASSVPRAHREKAFSSVMKEMANIHGMWWYTRSWPWLFWKSLHVHTRSDHFWDSQITSWHTNYDEARDIHGRQNKTDKFYEKMINSTKPANGEAKLIHGDMSISNVIFDDQFNVKAIVDWKYIKNGDPMVDVAYFCMMFLRPQDYGYTYGQVNNHPLLIGDSGPSEDDILSVYRRHCPFTFDTSVFLYAKAVSCLRLLSIMKFNVKAIVDWKYIKNGDPMVDVAYFCMMFLRPQDYGYTYGQVNNHPLLIGDSGPSEDDILSVYRRHCPFTFDTSVFLYAKAVSCLRLLSIMKVAIKDNFRGHESGDYRDNTAHPQLVMDCLTAAGEDYYRRSEQ
jgi:aminoglycoside phosphotransferase (APT) family kinase protein